MNNITLGKSGPSVPRIAVGCMQITKLERKAAREFIDTAINSGANFFDHADIYGNGDCEAFFSQAIEMSPSVREKIILQSKCGIVPGLMYDFSKEHILAAAEGILKRLKTDYLDVLLLHRPDALIEPEEVAEAFDKLLKEGKVRHFGVSNHNPLQIMLLQRYLGMPVAANQLQFSITNATMVSSGMNVNTENNFAVDRDGSILDFCRLNDITIQPWSPFRYGFFEGIFLGNEKFPKLNAVIKEIAENYGVSDTTIALAWILRHPAKMMPVTGTTNTQRLLDCIKAVDIKLTRSEWYRIYNAAGYILP